MWRLQGAQAQSYGFLQFRVTLQVSWHPMWQTSKNIVCVCVRALNPLTGKSSGVCLTVRTPTVLIICVRRGEGGASFSVSVSL